MTRTYAKSFLSMWAPGSDFLQLSTDAQWLYWVLFSHPSLTPAGTLPLQPRKWAQCSKDMTQRRVTAALADLVRSEKVIVDEDTEEVLIRTFIRWDKGWRTPNINTSIKASIAQIESDGLRHVATRELTLAPTLNGNHG